MGSQLSPLPPPSLPLALPPSLTPSLLGLAWGSGPATSYYCRHGPRSQRLTRGPGSVSAGRGCGTEGE